MSLKIWALSVVAAIVVACTPINVSVSTSDQTCSSGYSEVQYRDLTLCAANDYYQVDGIRTPLGFSAAERVAAENNARLPSVGMVDAIWQQADVRLTPRPMPPGPQMTSRDYFVRHDATIDQQLESTDYQPGDLVAGHKKDVLQYDASRVAIYGWQYLTGVPIQPRSTVHGREYYDYSHGIRLISCTAWRGIEPVDICDPMIR